LIRTLTNGGPDETKVAIMSNFFIAIRHFRSSEDNGNKEMEIICITKEKRRIQKLGAPAMSGCVLALASKVFHGIPS
jgi:hypothetical protein